MVGDRLDVGFPHACPIDPVGVDRQRDDDDGQEYCDDGDGAAAAERRCLRPVGDPVGAVERHHDDATGQNGGDIGREQQEGAESLMGGSGFECQAHDGQGRDQRDGDGHTGQGVGDVGTGEGDRADRARGQCGDQVDDPGRDRAGATWLFVAATTG